MLLPESAPTWLELLARVVILAVFISVTVLGLTYAERKALARFHRRVGPMRTGPFGLLQPIADAVKLLVKEDFTPAGVSRFIFWAAPLVVFVPSLLVWVSIPFTQDLVVRNLDLGLFYILAVSGLSTTGLLMAGWGSANKYSFLGASRAVAQLISYELPLIIVALLVVMMAQSTDLIAIVDGQKSVPNLALQPAAFLLFLLVGLAEVGRSPFDIFHAESEVIAGPYVEYSGMHWSMFFLAEYASTFAVAALTTLLFLGGWHWPFLPGVLWFAIKVAFILLVIFWIRATVPRFRIDQLMALAWKALLPLTFVNFALTAFYVYYDWPRWSMSLMSIALVVGVAYVMQRRARAVLRGAPRVRLVSGRLPDEGAA